MNALGEENEAMRTPSKLNSVLLLWSPAAAETATANHTAKTNAFLKGWRSGYALIDVKSADVTTTDEAYTIAVEGRDDAAAAYEVLGSKVFAAGAAAAGGYLVDIDGFKPDMRAVLTVAGTTPSILYSVYLICSQFTYGPGGTVISD